MTCSGRDPPLAWVLRPAFSGGIVLMDLDVLRNLDQNIPCVLRISAELFYAHFRTNFALSSKMLYFDHNLNRARQIRLLRLLCTFSHLVPCEPSSSAILLGQ